MLVPQNPLLPDAGSTASYYNITQAASTRGAQNYQTFETDFAPARTQYWHGVNANLNARLRNGLTVRAARAPVVACGHLRAVHGAARACCCPVG